MRKRKAFWGVTLACVLLLTSCGAQTSSAAPASQAPESTAQSESQHGNIFQNSDANVSEGRITVLTNVTEGDRLEELKKYDSNDIYVIGGESIYRQLLPYCDVAHVTCMDYTYQADTWFPNLDEDKDWVVAADSEERTYFDLEYCFKMYVRKTKLKEIVDLLK